MTIDIVDFPIKHGDLNHSYVKLPEGTMKTNQEPELNHEQWWLNQQKHSDFTV